MAWYPFCEYHERYAFIKYYDYKTSFYIVVAPEHFPEQKRTLYCSNYLHAWRIIHGTAAESYRKILQQATCIASHQQFSVYTNSRYIETFCHFAAHPPEKLQHLSCDFGNTIVETIIEGNLDLILCLGESIPR